MVGQLRGFCSEIATRTLTGVPALGVAHELYRDLCRNSAGLPGRVCGDHAEVLAGSYWGPLRFIPPVLHIGVCFLHIGEAVSGVHQIYKIGGSEPPEVGWLFFE